MTAILDEYLAKHPGSAQRFAEALGLFPGGVTHDTRYAEPFPLYMTHGSGPRKWDVDGEEYIDYVSGHGALILGHSHPAVAAAVAEQVTRGTHWAPRPTRKSVGPRPSWRWSPASSGLGSTVRGPKQP